jgi:hypothetical protein
MRVPDVQLVTAFIAAIVHVLHQAFDGSPDVDGASAVSLLEPDAVKSKKSILREQR